MDSVEKAEGSNSNNAFKKCALLLIVGEPFSEDDRKLILAEVTKGFSCWDRELIGFDINDELADIANKAALGEEGPNGERIIKHNFDNLAVEILVNPQSCSLTNAVKNFLLLHTKHKHLIYAKHAFQGTGAWILQDDVFTFHDFVSIFKDTNIDNAIRQQQGTSLYIYTEAEGDWNNSHIAKSYLSKILDVKVNPPAKLEKLHGVLKFTAYVSNFVRVRQLNELLQSSVVVGNIRFIHPTLYIFPACQGDSALFCVNGFNLLVNGGYNRKACFWDFTCHLDRIDAALITHLDTDNLFGIQSVFYRKSVENVHPDIGYLYCNTPDKMKTLTEITPEESGNKESLTVNIAEEGDKLVHYAKQIGLTPQPCLRTAHGNSIDPINLYQKIGIGSLDMYILNPVTDSKELKDFFHQWNQKVAHFETNQHLSLPSTLSVCALLVWHPADPNMKISRILFPGNAPQHKILEGLEKLKHLDILYHSSCTKMTLNTKQATKKPAARLFTKPPKSKVSPVITPKNELPKNEVLKKEVKEPVPPKTASPAKEKPVPLQKVKKEDVNKKAMKGPDKQKSEKSDKVKPIKPTKFSSSTKGSAKSSATSTPKEKSSPVKIPESVLVQDVQEGEPEVHEGEPEVLEGKQEVHESEQESHDSDVQEDDHAPSGAESGDHTSCDLLDNENDDTHVDSANSQEDSFEPTHMVMEEPESLVEVSALEDQESVVELAESDDVTASEVHNKNQFAPESEQVQESGALDEKKIYELNIHDKDQDIENKSGDEPESDEISQQKYGGLTDSMQQDLLGDVYQQDAMHGSFHGDLMTGSSHKSMFDDGQPFDDQGCMQNVDNILTPDDETSEEVQPQALPEPFAYAPDNYYQEPDVIPGIPDKEQSHIALCDDITPKIQEPDILPIKQDLYEQASLDINADDQIKIFDYKNTTPVFDDGEPLTEMSEEMANVITQECVEDNEVIEEKVMEDNEKVNSVAAMLDDAAEDMKGPSVDMDVPSYITGDLRQSSPDDKEYLVEGQSHIDEHDLLMQSRGDEPVEITSEMQNQIEEPSCVHDAIERQHGSETEVSEKQLFGTIDKEDRYQSIIVEQKYEHYGEDDTNVSDNKSAKFEREEFDKNDERIPSTELTESPVNKEEDEHIDECDKWTDKSKQQEFQIPEVNQERLTNANLLEFIGNHNEYIYQTDDTDKIVNDFEDETRNDLQEIHDLDDVRAESPDSYQSNTDIHRDSYEKEYCKETSQSPEPESKELSGGMENDFEDETRNDLQKIHDSEDVRAESPDSHQSNKDIHRDSHEREHCKETSQSPEPESEELSGGMENDFDDETGNDLQEIHDSEDVRADSPDSHQSNKDIHRDSHEREHCKETSQSPEPESEELSGGMENDFDDETGNDLQEIHDSEDVRAESPDSHQSNKDIHRDSHEREHCKETSQSPEPESEELSGGMENDFDDETGNDLQEIHDSEDVRADSPDSHQSNKDIHRDSHEREHCKETSQSPEPESEELSGGMENDFDDETGNDLQEIHDSEDVRADSPDSHQSNKDIHRDSHEREHCKETSQSPEPESKELRGGMENDFEDKTRNDLQKIHDSEDVRAKSPDSHQSNTDIHRDSHEKEHCKETSQSPEPESEELSGGMENDFDDETGNDLQEIHDSEDVRAESPDSHQSNTDIHRDSHEKEHCKETSQSPEPESEELSGGMENDFDDETGNDLQEIHDSEDVRAESPDSHQSNTDIHRDSHEKEHCKETSQSPEPESKELRGGMENDFEDETGNDLQEIYDSEDVRADSPASHQSNKDIHRDSLEKEYCKETCQSPEIDSEEFKGKMEMDYEQQQPEDDGQNGAGDQEDEAEVSEDNENGEKERSMYEADETDELNETEECESNLEQAENVLDSRESVERDIPDASPHPDSDHCVSADQSYENDCGKSEEDEVGESSSFEQEEITNEKYLIQDSISEAQRGWDERPFELVQGDKDAEQTSDNVMTSESDIMEPSNSGQVGYHQKEDHGDSAGFEDENYIAATQPGQNNKTYLDQDYSYIGGPEEFNPSAVWGEPMGLPFPAPPGDTTDGTAIAANNSPKPKLGSKVSDTRKTNEKKLDAKTPAMSLTKKPASAPKSGASNGVLEKAKTRLSTGGPGANSNSSKSSANVVSSKVSTVEKPAPAKAATKPRAVSAPIKDKEVTDSKPKQNGTKRSATANVSVVSPAAVKMPSLPPFSCYYFELTYIPNHGNLNYIDREFFKRVRARYYVLSALSPSTQVLDALLEGKKTWEARTLPVTVIPTYDNEAMRLWMILNKDALSEENVEIAPSASRCTIQLQDHETSSSAYRLEF